MPFLILGAPKVPHISLKSLEARKNVGARFKRKDGRFYEYHPQKFEQNIKSQFRKQKIGRFSAF
jgi:hypothetical protein